MAKKKRAKKKPAKKEAPKKKPAAKKTTQARTERERIRKRQYSRRVQSEDAEIGPPQITAAQRRKGDALRKKCEDSLLNFNVLCFPRSTGLKPFGQVQLDSIAQDQAIIEQGGKVCKAEPRGYGKTTRGRNAALWAVLFGKRRMVSVFSANLEKSRTLMDSWKTELANNDLLYWMFPELIWPLRCLENKPQRCASQTYKGKLTNTKWRADRIALPFIKDVKGAGGFLVALPLKSCRGAIHPMPDGTVLRPDLLVFDDVQRDEDAENPKTISKLEKLIEHTAMLLGGHSQSMSCIMNCTVRRVDDLSEQYLKKPSWRRVRYKMLTKPALREKELWLGTYAELRTNFDPDNPDDQKRAHKEALKFYIDHREAMDEGAEVTWDWAYAWADDDPVEISSLQHAYNYLVDSGEDVFASECQNEPIRDTGGLIILTASEIARKQSGYDRLTFPPECIKLTAFVDVHPSILYWQVWAWQQMFTGFLIEDETMPPQRSRSFSHNALSIPLDVIFPGMDDGARVTAGLDLLIHGNAGRKGLLGREFIRTDGVPMKIDVLGIDANGSQASEIKAFIRQSPYSSRMYASFGRGIGATGVPMSQWQQARKGGYRDEWVPTAPVPGEPPGLTFDTNHWKTRWHKGMALPPGSQGCLYLYREDPEHHQMFGDHANAELPKEVIYQSRVVYEFPRKPTGDNHKFDTAVSAMVAASKAGISSTKPAPPRKKVSLAELRARAHQRRSQRGK